MRAEQDIILRLRASSAIFDHKDLIEDVIKEIQSLRVKYKVLSDQYDYRGEYIMKLLSRLNHPSNSYKHTPMTMN